MQWSATLSKELLRFKLSLGKNGSHVVIPLDVPFAARPEAIVAAVLAWAAPLALVRFLTHHEEDAQ